MSNMDCGDKDAKERWSTAIDAEAKTTTAALMGLAKKTLLATPGKAYDEQWKGNEEAATTLSSSATRTAVTLLLST